MKQVSAIPNAEKEHCQGGDQGRPGQCRKEDLDLVHCADSDLPVRVASAGLGAWRLPQGKLLIPLKMTGVMVLHHPAVASACWPGLCHGFAGLPALAVSADTLHYFAHPRVHCVRAGVKAGKAGGVVLATCHGGPVMLPKRISMAIDISRPLDLPCPCSSSS